MFHKRILAALLALFSLTLSACSGATSAGNAQAADQNGTTLRVGVTAGIHEEIMEQVAKILAEEGIQLKIRVFTDYRTPNEALANGELDANSYQHLPYLEKEVAEQGYDLVSVGTTINAPMGVYSQKVSSLDELKDGDVVALPSDPTNGGRALLLFQEAGLIKLDPDAGILATVRDITENPRHLEFREMDAPQLPRVLPDVAAAAINTNFAMDAGLKPAEDAIYLEPSCGPYVNIIAVRAEDKDRPEIQKLVEAYHSPAIRQYIEETYQGNFQAAW